MPEQPRPITTRLLDYVASHARGEDPLLSQLKRDATAAGIPNICVSAAQGTFLEILLRTAKARRVIEVGTLAGYAAIRMARAIPPDGHVDTIELDPERAAFAEAWIAKSDVANRVTVHRGDARDVLRGFDASSADAMFIDADKDGYDQYLTEALRIVRVGGLVLVDNAFAFGQLFDDVEPDSSVAAIRAINNRIAAMPELDGIIAPFGDGCWVATKTANLR